MMQHSMACSFPEGCSCGASDWNELERQNAVLRAALEDIRTTAHCLAKAGPLSTPTLDKAWGHFLSIDAKASAALFKARTHQPTSP